MLFLHATKQNVAFVRWLFTILIANRHSHAHHSLIGKTQTTRGGMIPAQQICQAHASMLANLTSIIVLILHNILKLFSMEITMKTLLLTMLLFLMGGHALYSQRFICPDSCAYWPATMPNTNSVRYDSCMVSHFLYPKFQYSNSEFELNLIREAVPSLPKLPRDTIVYLDWRNDIDTTFTVLRSRLESLETVVGAFTLTRGLPCDTNARYFIFTFDKWVNIDSMSNLFTDSYNIGRCSHPGPNFILSHEYVDTESPTIHIVCQENQIKVHTDKVIQEIKIWDQQGRLVNTISESTMIEIPTHCTNSLLFIEIICSDRRYIFKEIFQ